MSIFVYVSTSRPLDFSTTLRVSLSIRARSCLGNSSNSSNFAPTCLTDRSILSCVGELSRVEVPDKTEQPSTLVRTRTVIDQSQTLLYCSEACRKKDLESSWPMPMPSACEFLERDSSSDRLKSTDPAHASPSPPPPSPVLLPVPPNSSCAPNLRVLRVLDLGATRSSRAPTRTRTRARPVRASPRAPAPRKGVLGKSEPDGLSNLYTDPAPPPLPPLPLHPHRVSAPASAPRISNTSADKRTLFEGGEGGEEAAGGSSKKEEERGRSWDLTGEAEREARANRRAGKVEAKPEEAETIDPALWSDLVHDYGSNPNPSTPAGVISTHRRPSTGAGSDPQTNAENAPTVRAPGAPTRTQSALEPYAKYLLFVRAPSSSSTSPAPRMKSNASFATSYATAFDLVT
ncbi:hypothetical protein DFH11DRAFT_1731255 [Phellopilus nigrolimitatus]|nr:hypothetical protein DFH11DRAFT_1731255 [Phellopilus nigrolimitatus]